MSEIIQALPLTTDERASILTFWDSQEEFLLWQRDTLADEIMRRAQTAAQTQAQEIMTTATSEVEATFPSLFPDAETPEAEAAARDNADNWTLL